MGSLTTISIFVLAGYGILQILLLFLTDRILLHRVKDRNRYRRHRPVWMIPFLLLSLVPPAGTFLPSERAAAVMAGIGNVFLGWDLFYGGILLSCLFLYGLLCLLFRRRKVRQSTPKAPFVLFLCALAASVCFPVYGFFHAQQPVTHYFRVDLSRSESSLENFDSRTDDPGRTDSTGRTDHPDINTISSETTDYRIVLIADLHLSVNSFPTLTKRMVTQVNQAEPDLILVGGDIFTSSYEALRNPEIYAAELRKLRAKDGVYAVYGNHDVEERLFAGFAVSDISHALRSEKMTQFFKDCGFTILDDETVEIAGGTIRLAGRRDRNKPGDGTADRMSAGELLSGLDPDKPILVLEHEPVEYAALREAGADLVLSGHTHNGQIVPGNFFVKLFNENGYGYRDISGMATFVTSGVGYFGPPMRVGTDSEVMVIDLCRR